MKLLFFPHISYVLLLPGVELGLHLNTGTINIHLESRYLMNKAESSLEPFQT